MMKLFQKEESFDKMMLKRCQREEGRLLQKLDYQNQALQGSVEPVHKPAGEAFDNQEHLGGGQDQPHLDEDICEQEPEHATLFVGV